MGCATLDQMETLEDFKTMLDGASIVKCTTQKGQLMGDLCFGVPTTFN